MKKRKIKPLAENEGLTPAWQAYCGGEGIMGLIHFIALPGRSQTVLWILLVLLISWPSLAERCHPGLVLPKNPYAVQTWEALKRRRSLIFPKDYQVSKSDPLFRKALIEVHGQLDFYTRLKVPLNDIQVDHIWPESDGGPNNILNFVLSSSRENRNKSAHADLRSVTFWLSLNNNHYAHRVAKRYFELKQQTRPRRLDPQTREKLNQLVQSSRLPKDGKTLLSEILAKRAVQLEDPIMRLAKLTVNVFESLAEKRLLRSGREFYSGTVDALLVYSEWELSHNRSVNETRAIETFAVLVNSAELPAPLLKTFRDLSRRNFTRFQQGHRFLMDLSDLLTTAHQREQRWSHRLRRWVVGQSLRPLPVRAVRELASAFLIENALRAGEKVTPKDYLSGIEVLINNGIALSEIQDLARYLLQIHHDIEKSFEDLAVHAAVASHQCADSAQKMGCTKRKLSRWIQSGSLN